MASGTGTWNSVQSTLLVPCPSNRFSLCHGIRHGDMGRRSVYSTCPMSIQPVQSLSWHQARGYGTAFCLLYLSHVHPTGSATVIVVVLLIGGGRGGLEVRSRPQRRVPGSKPDSSEDPPYVTLCVLNHTWEVKHPPLVWSEVWRGCTQVLLVI
ncbi:hypothetical protein AVEN_181830-1 [Araneus ventricosus]|uniref:Uncharacterized protein n=1 Tax=Araneus ventricosus TaxID=182803 RepID=A0A4Y2F0E5_ARAVE|nr:hypothetical protein AVEN_181830-1 [Araneus ventricosus]